MTRCGETAQPMGEGVNLGSGRGISERGLFDLGAVQGASVAPERYGRLQNRRQGRVKEASGQRFEGGMV
jgi:hypothetical protein